MSINPHSSDWRQVREWAQAEITAAQGKLEQPLDPIETSALRGRIKAMRDLLTHGEPPPAPEAPTGKRWPY